MSAQEGTTMVRHATMPPRTQRTPHGDVTLTSRWYRDRFYLVAFGCLAAVRWMFPSHQGSFEQTSSAAVRHTFAPHERPITDERKLRRIAAKWQDQWENDLHEEAVPASGSATAPAPIESLGHLFDHLFVLRKATLRATTVERDRYYLTLWRRELGVDRLLCNLAQGVLLDARARVAAATSNATANDAFAVLRTYLGWGFNQGLTPNSAIRNIKRLRVPRSERQPRAWWTPDEVELALQLAAKDEQAHIAVPLVALGCLAGMRPEEIIMQRWSDIDLDMLDPKTGSAKPIIHVVGHDGWEPKDSEARDIPVSERLRSILLRWRKPNGYLLEADVVRTKRKEGANTYRYDPKKVWKRLMAAVVAAGGKRITAYGMRHSFSSNFLIAGVSDVKVARWMGHADTRMVHKHYGHLLAYDADINAVRYAPMPERAEPPSATIADSEVGSARNEETGHPTVRRVVA
jgi:integrase